MGTAVLLGMSKIPTVVLEVASVETYGLKGKFKADVSINATIGARFDLERFSKKRSCRAAMLAFNWQMLGTTQNREHHSQVAVWNVHHSTQYERLLTAAIDNASVFRPCTGAEK